MAITLTNDNVDGYGFVANGYSADWSGCETLKAAVAGVSIYIEKIHISPLADEIVTIGAGETAGAVTTTLLGPLHVLAQTTTTLVFTRPIKLAAATALTADAAGAGAITIVVQGYVK